MPSPNTSENDFDVKDLPDTSMIWRYMDLSKLLWTLSTSSMYFPSIAALCANDPFEGILPPAYLDKFRAKWPQLPEPVRNHLCEYTQQRLGHRITSLDDIMGVFQNEYARLSRITFVNCWYYGTVESAAMWTLYAAKGSGVAIRTRAGRLKNALRMRNPGNEFMARLVCYYDQTDQELPNLAEGINTVAFLKRYSYAHECEYRIALESSPPSRELSSGLILECDLEELFERVVISPYAEDYIVSSVRDLLERYSLKCESGKSSLMEIR